jgi:hypothetical protein
LITPVDSGKVSNNGFSSRFRSVSIDL